MTRANLLSPVSATLGVVLVLGAVLRFTGLHWGIPTEALPHVPFHPDETWAMDVLKQISLSTGQLNPRSAHSEGTLAFYVWTGAALAARLLGVVSHMPSEISDFGRDYQRILYLSRVVVVLFDLGSIVLVYLTVLKITRDRRGALFGAFIFAIFPFEIVYSHYIRSHVVANFFIVLSAYLSMFLVEREDKRQLIAVGMVSGFAAATRYPAGLVLGVPIALLVYKKLIVERGLRRGIKGIWEGFTQAPLRWLGAAFFLGFLLGDPFLFLRFDTARASLARLGQYVAYSEFSWTSLFDLSRLWVYIKYLIPYGTLPALWIVLYGAVIYALLCRRRYPYTLPLLAFSFVSLYLMGKGYLGVQPEFVRVAMSLFPGFAIFAGIAFGDVWQWLQSRRMIRGAMALALAAIAGATLLYDFGYVNAMSRDDARLQLYRFFSDEVPESQPVVGYWDRGHGYFLVQPALELVKSRRLEYVSDAGRLQRMIDGQDPVRLDYLILSVMEEGDQGRTESKIQELVHSGRFTFVRKFSNPIRILGITFEFAHRPHDLEYPFPEFYLLKHT